MVEKTMKKLILMLTMSLLFAATVMGGCSNEEPSPEASPVPTKVEANLEVGMPSSSHANSTQPLLIRVSWSKVKDATGYEVYRSVDEDEEFELIATEMESEEKARMWTLDRDVEVGVEYYYKIRAFVEHDDGMEYSEYSDAVHCHSRPSAVANLAATADTATVSLSWDALDYATGYEVERAVEKDGEYQVVATIVGTQYVDTDVQLGDPYFYRVRAYVDTGTEEETSEDKGTNDAGTRVYGSYSAEVKITLVTEEAAEAGSEQETDESTASAEDSPSPGSDSGSQTGSGDSPGGGGNNSGDTGGGSETQPTPAPAPTPTPVPTPAPTPEPAFKPATCNICSSQGITFVMYDMDDVDAHFEYHWNRGERDFSYSTN